MRRSSGFEIVAGGIVLAVAAGFLAYMSLQTGAAELSTYDIQARMRHVDGLAAGGDVTMGGVKIGTIEDMALNPKTYLVTVRMAIRSDVRLPVDSRLEVAQGTLSSARLTVTPGGARQTVPPGGVLPGVR